MNNSHTDLSGNKINKGLFDYDVQPVNQKKRKISASIIFLFIFIYILVAMLLPSCILFFLTRWSAQSAFKTTICGDPAKLASLIGSVSGSSTN
jgi:hypothetical protein